MQKKEEFESARLMDFEFRQRARATKLLAQAYQLDPLALTRDIAIMPEAALLEHFATRTGRPLEEVSSDYGRYLAEARKELIAERGDPTPYRLG